MDKTSSSFDTQRTKRPDRISASALKEHRAPTEMGESESS